MSPEPFPVIDIDPVATHPLLDAGATLLDVRENDEWAAGHAPGATHLAMGSVSDRIVEIPSDRIVVCVCRVGGRSRAVAELLAGEGYDVRNLDGGMLAWEAAGYPVVGGSGEPGRII